MAAPLAETTTKPISTNTTTPPASSDIQSIPQISDENEVSKDSDPKASDNANGFTKSVTMAEAVRHLVKDVKDTEREQEIHRILRSMKIDPVSILEISLDLDEKNIKSQYRKKSLLIHPDRCPEYLKHDAQRAFTMLNDCKKDLENKEFVVKLK